MDDARSTVRTLQRQENFSSPSDMHGELVVREDAGAVSKLYDACIKLSSALLEHCQQRPSPLSPELEAKLENSSMMLRLWGAGFQVKAGDLDRLLHRASDLREVVLFVLASIGEAILGVLLPRIVSSQTTRKHIMDSSNFFPALIAANQTVPLDNADGDPSAVHDQDAVPTALEDLRTYANCLNDLNCSLETVEVTDQRFLGVTTPVNHMTRALESNGSDRVQYSDRADTDHINKSDSYLTHHSPKKMPMYSVPPPRPFVCPLQPYGCHVTFASKNEWKRHLISRHFWIGFWRCDLCPDAQERPNDFNRKDLFSQHLRRMHGPKATLAAHRKRSGSKKQKPRDYTLDDDSSPPMLEDGKIAEFERGISEICDRCWIRLRDPPQELQCNLCKRVFAGQRTTDDWLEHVGRHLAKDAKEQRHKGGSELAGGDAGACDDMLRDWMLQEGLLKRTSTGIEIPHEIHDIEHNAILR